MQRRQCIILQVPPWCRLLRVHILQLDSAGTDSLLGDYWMATQSYFQITLAGGGSYSTVTPPYQGVTKRCRLSCEPKCGGRGSQPLGTAVHRSPNKLWRYITPYLPYAPYQWNWHVRNCQFLSCSIQWAEQEGCCSSERGNMFKFHLYRKQLYKLRCKQY